jgi:hypothetical protein
MTSDPASVDANPDDEELSNSTTRLIANFNSTYLSVRNQSIDKTVFTFQQTIADTDVKPGQYRRLARSILNAFIEGHYSEKSFRSKLLNAISVALTSNELPFDFKTFASDYLLEHKGRWLLPSTKASVIEICLVLLKAIEQLDTTLIEPPSWAHVCIQVIGEMLDTVSSDRGGKNEKIVAKCTGNIGNFLKNRQQLLDCAISCWTEASYICSLSHLYVYFTSTKIVAPYDGPSKRPKTVVKVSISDTANRISKSLGNLVYKKVLNSKQPLPAAILNQIGSYLKILSTSEWNDSNSLEMIDATAAVTADGGGLEASTWRTMKKSPEGSSALIASILSHVSVDLTNFVRCGAATTALRIVKSPNPDVREKGSVIIRNLAAKCADSSAFEGMVKIFSEALHGKGPAALVQPYQRLAVLVALSDCAEGSHVPSMGRAFVSDLATSVVPALITAIDKENDENNMLVAAEALGRWMGYMLTLAQPATLLDSLKTGLGRSKGHCVAYLTALTLALKQNSEHSNHFSSLITSLANIVKDAGKKPSNQTHIEAVLAYRILLEMSLSSSAAVAAIDAAKLGAFMIPSTSSFLYTKAFMQQVYLAPSQPSSATRDVSMQQQYEALPRGTRNLNSLASESVSAIVTLVSMHHPLQLSCVPASSQTAVGSEGPVGSTLSCLLHPDRAVRAAAAKNTLMLFSNSTAADEKSSSTYPTALKMIKALDSCLARWSDQLEAAVAGATRPAAVPGAGAVSEDEVSGCTGQQALRVQLGIPPSSRIAGALKVLVSPWQCAPRTQGGNMNVNVPSAQTVVAILMACSHPLVCESRDWASQMWISLTSSLSRPIAEIFDEEESRVTTSKRVVAAAMSSSAKLTRQSAHTALFILSTAIGQSSRMCVLQHVLPSLKEEIAMCGVNAVSDDDIDKYRNPLAAIAAASAVAEPAEADIRITNADRKKDSGRSRRNGAFGGDFVEDEDWAEKVKKEKAQKLALSKSAGQAEGNSAKLKDLEELQVRVRAIVDTATYALEAYHSLTTFSELPSNMAAPGPSEAEAALDKTGRMNDIKLRAVTRSSVCLMLPVLLPLMRCPLAANTAFLCVLGLCKGIESEIVVTAARDLADSLRITATVSLRPLARRETQDVLYKEMLGLGAPLQRLLRTVQTHLSRTQSQSQQQHRQPKQHALLPSTVHLLFPVLRGLLGMPTMLPGCDFAFMVLDA